MRSHRAGRRPQPPEPLLSGDLPTTLRPPAWRRRRGEPVRPAAPLIIRGRRRMGMVREVLGFLGFTEGPGAPSGASAPEAGFTAAQRRELVAAMRRLGAQYADRLPPGTGRRVAEAAAAGRWEKAVDRLVTVLSSRSVPVTSAERAELRAILTALDMPGDRVSALPHRPATERCTHRPMPSENAS